MYYSEFTRWFPCVKGDGGSSFRPRFHDHWCETLLKSRPILAALQFWIIPEVLEEFGPIFVTGPFFRQPHQPDPRARVRVKEVSGLLPARRVTMPRIIKPANKDANYAA